MLKVIEEKNNNPTGKKVFTFKDLNDKQKEGYYRASFYAKKYAKAMKVLGQW